MDLATHFFSVLYGLLAIGFVAIVWLSGAPSTRPFAFALCIVLAAFSLCAGTPFAFFAAGILFAAVLFAAACRRRWMARLVVGIPALCLFIAVGAVAWMVASSRLQEIDRLREQHPAVSVAPRLEYEVRSLPARMAHPIALSDDVAAALQKADEMPYSARLRSLEQVHDDHYRRFVAQPGFGFSRMRGIYERDFELPPVEAIDLPDPPPLPFPYPTPESSLAAAADLQGVPTDFDGSSRVTSISPSESFLSRMHTEGERDFLNADRLGYARNRDFVAGFESHRFTTPLAIDPAALPATSEARWQVSRVELVSLLTHETPVVYVSSQLPAMDALEDAPVRPLDDFEAASLRSLQGERNIVIENRTREIRMLGALRAGKACLNCHQAQWGELLGAFSYAIHRPDATAAPAAPLNLH